MGSLREIVSEHLGEAMGRAHAGGAPQDGGGVPLPGHAVGREDRPAPDPTSPGSPARGRTSIAAPLEKLAGGDARILRPVDDSPSLRDLPRRPRAAAARLAGALPCGEAPAPRRRPRHGGRGRRGDRARCWSPTSSQPAWLDKAELRTLDARFALRGDVAVEPDIVIVDLDDASLAALGAGGDRIPRRSPRAHDRHPAGGRCGGDRLRRRVPRARPPRTRALRGAIERAGPQLLLRRHADRQRGPGPDPRRSGRGAVRRASGTPGSRSRATAPTARWTSRSACPAPSASEPGSRRLESFAVVAAGLAGDPAERFERAWIDFHGPARTFPHVRFTDVLRGADPSRFEGKVVVVGTSARKQGDLHATAAGGGRVMSGAEIQANAHLDAAPRESRSMSSGRRAMSRSSCCSACSRRSPRSRIRPRLAALARRWRRRASTSPLAQLLFSAGWIVPVLYPLLALLLSAAGVFAARAAGARRLSRARLTLTRLRWPAPHAGERDAKRYSEPGRPRPSERCSPVGDDQPGGLQVAGEGGGVVAHPGDRLVDPPGLGHRERAGEDPDGDVRPPQLALEAARARRAGSPDGRRRAGAGRGRGSSARSRRPARCRAGRARGTRSRGSTRAGRARGRRRRPAARRRCGRGRSSRGACGAPSRRGARRRRRSRRVAPSRRRRAGPRAR